MNLETEKWWTFGEVTFDKVTPFGTDHAQFYMFYFQEDRVDESF